MRLVASFEKEDRARRFSLFLEKEKIENSYEVTYDRKQRKTLYNIWVHNEDDLAKAIKYYEEFVSDPTNHRYDVKLEDIAPKKDEEVPMPKPQHIDPVAAKRIFPYKVTYFLLLLCVVLFFVNFMQGINLLKKYNLKELVLLTPLESVFLYDLPPVRLQLDDVIIKYRLDSAKKLENPPIEAQKAIEEIEKKPSWRGFYDIILEKFQKQGRKYERAPLFEKIRQGEIWRIFTPIILHSGFLHIIFNMLWLWYLGKQMEPRLRFIRYVLFIIIVAAISNTAQYLMGGPYFLGFSGIITGMVGYIYIRQKVAPWEGYNIPNAVFYFIAIFIFAMMFLQVTSFVFQIFKPKIGFTPGIANTAHIVGAVIGMILAKIPFFTWRTGE